MISMKATPWERYGGKIKLFLLFLLAWFFVTSELHLSPVFQSFSPLYWLSLTLFGGALDAFAVSFDTTFWWMGFEIASMMVGWFIVYTIVRGAIYSISSMEGPSMWVAFGLFILFAILFCMFLLKPTFTQMAIWWTAWPTATSPRLP